MTPPPTLHRRPSAAGIIAALLFSALSVSIAAAAAPVIEPELRDMAIATSRGQAVPAGLQMYATPNRQGGAEWVSVWLQGTVDRGAVEALGGRVGTVAGGWMTAQVPLQALQGLTNLPGLERAQIARGLVPQNNVSVPLIGAPALWGGTPPNYPSSGKTGKRVVIGIVDAGIDVTHQDFMKPGTRNTRIKWLWNQNGTASPQPSFRYGTEYTSSAIDSGKCTAAENYPHGTWMASAAAGNGQGTGNGKPRYTYIGIAPEADLVVVTVPTYTDGSMPDAQVIDGVNYVFQKAAALGEPAIVLLAVSKMTGPHDGHDPLDEAITALTGPGKIVCAAAGNYGGTARHAVAQTTTLGQTVSVTFTVPAHNPSLEQVTVEGWYDQAASYSIAVISPTGQIAGPFLKAASGSLSLTGYVITVGNGIYRSDNGSSRVDLSVCSTTGGTIASGTWTIQLVAKASGTYKSHFWLTNFVGFTPTFVQGMTDSCLVTSPATADSVIAVGAYCTRPTWVALNGSTYGFAGASQNTIASFSGAGPRRDGRPAPNITGPGLGVAVSRSAGYYPLYAYMMPDSAHCMTNGTSLATGLVAGVVAIVLQDNPGYGRGGVMSYLSRNAVVDGYTGQVPNNRWGVGKVRLAGSTTAVLPGARTGAALSLRSASPGRGAKEFEIMLAPEDVAAGKATFQILDVAGRRVGSVPITLRPGDQILEWNGLGQDGSPASPGLYWARLDLKRGSSSVRFVQIR